MRRNGFQINSKLTDNNVASEVFLFFMNASKRTQKVANGRRDTFNRICVDFTGTIW